MTTPPNDKILPEPKPCPFCNSNVLNVDSYVDCPNCGGSGPFQDDETDNYISAVKRWNQRTPAEPIAVDAREIEDALRRQNLDGCGTTDDEYLMAGITGQWLREEDQKKITQAAKAYAAICADPQPEKREAMDAIRLLKSYRHYIEDGGIKSLFVAHLKTVESVLQPAKPAEESK